MMLIQINPFYEKKKFVTLYWRSTKKNVENEVIDKDKIFSIRYQFGTSLKRLLKSDEFNPKWFLILNDPIDFLR